MKVDEIKKLPTPETDAAWDSTENSNAPAWVLARSLEQRLTCLTLFVEEVGQYQGEPYTADFREIVRSLGKEARETLAATKELAP